ncbi:MAG: TonB-dependent receptor [Bdellovibrionales bacterium]|nr:TonB-dependent receptor [Bdellovibrionales bacterium]
MLRFLIFLSILCTPAFLARAQEISQDSLKIEEIKPKYEMEVLEVAPSEEPVRSFIGKSFDQEIDKETLNNSQVNTMGELVDQIPGVENLGGPRKEAQGITIRGFQESQVLLLLDGTRSNFSMTHNSVVPVRTHLLKKVDLIKGGASSRFGNGALGGLVSFTTIDADDLIPPRSKTAMQIRNMYSDVSALNQTSLTAASHFGERSQGGVVADVTSSRAHDVTLSNNSALPYSGYEDESIWAKGNWSNSRSRVWFSAEQQAKTSVTPGNPSQEDGTSNPIENQEEKYTAFKAQYKREGRARIRPEVLVYQSTTEMDRRRVDNDRHDNRKVDTLGLSLHSTVDVLKSSDEQPLRWTLQPGVELIRDQNFGVRDGGHLPSFPDGEANHIGAYTLTELMYQDRVWAQAGMRYDEVELITHDQNLEDRLNKAWSPDVEVGYQWNENLSTSISYEEGYNAPKIQDMYVDGYHFSAGAFGNNVFIPNPNLQPEDSKTVEGKVTYEYGSFGKEGSLEWSEYQSVIDNYIYQYVDIFGGTTQFINTPQVKLQGREISWKQNLKPIKLGASYARVRGIKSSNGEPLSTAPADQLRSTIEYEKAAWVFGLENFVYFKQNRVDKTILSSDDETPGSVVYNASVGYRFSDKNFSGATRLKVNNIFDREYKKHGSPLLEPGRDIRLELVLAL